MIRILTYPWEAISVSLATDRPTDNPVNQPWGAFVITNLDETLKNKVTGATFPSKKVGKVAKVYELHGPAIKGELARSLTISSTDVSQRLVFIQEKSSSPKHNGNKFEPFFDQTLDSMLLILREGLKNEVFKQQNHYWKPLLDLLIDEDQNDPAKYSLVVDLARPKSFLEPLKQITDHPKHVLRRIHDQERVQKVREIDTKCVVDLAKRPGAIIAEKAGPKQRILAIRRTESIDVLENRVALHACKLVDRASRRYLAEHDKLSSSESKRVSEVERLQRTVLRYTQKDSFRGVSSLIKPCRQPNYTLMQNADYYRIWKVYVALVKNEDLRNQMWLWNRRLWKDYMAMFLSQALYACSNELGPDVFMELHEKTILGRRKHRFGEWLLDDCLPGPFIIEPKSKLPGSLYLLNGNMNVLKDTDPRLEICGTLNSDYCFIHSKGNSLSVLPVYSIIPSPHLDSTQYNEFINQLLPSLLKELKQFSSNSKSVRCVGGWILLGNWDGSEILPVLKNMKVNLTCWLSEISADSSDWGKTQSTWEKPLLTMLGL